MTVFFTSVGFMASFKLLKKGGIQVVIFLVVAIVLVVLQDVLGTGLAAVFGLDPRLGLCMGSIPLVGGHGTSGSFGPTTAGRMDPYVDLFQSHGGSMVMIAKGNRSQAVTDSCKKHGGFYLGSIGGPAAILAQDNIKKVELVEYPELGMEAVWKIEVENFPAFILVDDKGNDFFKQL